MIKVGASLAKELDSELSQPSVNRKPWQTWGEKQRAICLGPTAASQATLLCQLSGAGEVQALRVGLLRLLSPGHPIAVTDP